MSFKNEAHTGSLIRCVAQNKSGFTILETIVAMAMIGAVVTLIVMMNSTVLQRARIASDRLDRMVLFKRFINEARSKTDGKTGELVNYEVEHPTPPTKLRYQRSRPAQNSMFAAIKDIYIERATAQWQTAGQPMTETVVTATYIPPPQPKKAGA